jgi:hypothetical protein
MAAPTNTTLGTAQVIASVPSTTVEVVQDAVGQEVWFAYTAQAGETNLGFSILGSGAGYYPTATLYEVIGGVPSQSTQWVFNFTSIPGDTYWVRSWNLGAGPTTDATLYVYGTATPGWVPPDPGDPSYIPINWLTIDSLPATVDVEVTDLPSPMEYWFKYVAPVGATAVGVYATVTPGHTTTYVPELTTWSGTLADPWLVANTGWGSGLPVFMGVVPGQTYWFQVINVGGASPSDAWLRLSVLPAPTLPVPAGSLLITSDQPDTVGVALSATDGAILQTYFPTPNSEWGAILPSGVMLIQRYNYDYLWVDSPAWVVLDASFQEIAHLDVVNPANYTWGVVTDNHDDTFYIATLVKSSSDYRIQTVSEAGVFSSTIASIPSVLNTIAAMAVSPDESVLYFVSGTGSGGAGCAIQQWDLVNDVALANLVADDPTKQAIFNLVCLADGSLLLPLQGSPSVVRHYNASGTLLHTYSFGAEEIDRITRDLTDDTFWVRVWPTGHAGGTSRFDQVRISDGVVVTTFTLTDFYAARPNLVGSTARFGPPITCPLFVAPQSSTPAGSTGTGDWSLPLLGWTALQQDAGLAGAPVKRLIRRLRQTAHLSDEDVWLFFDHFQVDCETGIGLPAGQGSDPQMMLQWSDDHGHTWSSEHWVSAGAQGRYRWRAMWRRLGRSRDRVWRVVVSDPVDWTLIDAYVGVTKGQN